MPYKKAAYGKRPLWQWVAIYLVIGALVYGLIYYFAFARSGSSYQTPTYTGQQSSY